MKTSDIITEQQDRRYQKNSLKGGTLCEICGKVIQGQPAYYVYENQKTGELIEASEENPDQAIFLAIGTQCAKNKKLKPYIRTI